MWSQSAGSGLASIAWVTGTNAPVCATAAGIARPADATAPNKDAATRQDLFTILPSLDV
jgi:hypothetical protein